MGLHWRKPARRRRHRRRPAATVMSLLSAPSSSMTDTSAFESALLADPSHDYARMDAASRALYRDAVEAIAARVRRSPLAVAATAVRLAKERCDATPPGDATRHVGYFLVAEGRAQLYAALTHTSLADMPAPAEARVVAWYAAGIVAGGLLLGGAAIPWFRIDELGPVAAALATVLLLLHAVGRTTVLGTIAVGMTPQRRLPVLDFSAGLPPDCVTAVCVPTMVTDHAHVAGMAAEVERHWLTIGDDNVRIVLLTDWPDADQQAPTREEAALLDALAARVDRLNETYVGGGRTRFYLLHRARCYSRTERCWMGWERKRGKLLQFNRAIAEDAHDFARVVGDLPDLRRATYAIVVDDNTVLAPGAVQVLLGTMAHPVARLQPVAGAGAMRGYGALAPDVGPGDEFDGQNRRTPASGSAGTPSAAKVVRKVDFDFFGECTYPGQGIYDIRWAHRQLERRFPEGSVLSHDVIESGFLRCGFSERARFIERDPQSYRLFNERWHRWMRGDWQNLWVMLQIRAGREDAGTGPRLIQWFWVIQNAVLTLPRVTLAGLLAVVVLGDPRFAGRRLAIVLALDILPDCVDIGYRLVHPPGSPHRRMPSLSKTGRALGKLLYIMIVRVASAFYGACMRVDVIVSVMVRIIRRRRLLEWVSSGHLERGGMKYRRLDAYTWLAPAAALLCGGWLWTTGRGSPSGLGVLALTVLWPVTVWAANRKWRSAGNRPVVARGQ
jgi:cyclic beta-1,2-glucan synthetase